MLKSFEKAKGVSYLGLEFQVQLETAHLALETFHDSDNAMVIAFLVKRQFGQLHQEFIGGLARHCA